MGLVSVDLSQPLEPVEWLVPGLVPSGHVTILGSLPGLGKSALLAHLAWQLSRPRGVFLDRELEQAPAVYVDFDAPDQGRGLRPWLERSQAAYRDGNRKLITLIEPDSGSYSLGDAELEQLHELVLITQARLVVLDSFMACFPNLNSSRLDEAMTAMWHLRRLARETRAAVVVIDHLPKPLPGLAETRGPMGSQAKQAQARAVHLLHRLPPDVTGDRHMLRWETTKTSFAALPEPFGVSFNLERGLQVHIEPLPENLADTRTARAARLVVEHLQQNAGAVVPKAELARLVVDRFNLSKRPLEAAIRQAVDQLGNVELVTLPGRGSPIGYRFAPDMVSKVSQMPETQSRTAMFLDTGQVSQKIPQTPKTPSGTEVFLDTDKVSKKPTTQAELFTPEAPSSPGWPIMVARKKT